MGSPSRAFYVQKDCVLQTDCPAGATYLMDIFFHSKSLLYLSMNPGL